MAVLEKDLERYLSQGYIVSRVYPETILFNPRTKEQKKFDPNNASPEFIAKAQQNFLSPTQVQGQREFDSARWRPATRDVFLDILFQDYPETFQALFSKHDGLGSAMINDLKANDPKRFKPIADEAFGN